MGREMKAVGVMTLVLVAAATGLTYGGADVAASVGAAVRTSGTTEPAVLLVSGSLLLGLAGAVRRFML